MQLCNVCMYGLCSFFGCVYVLSVVICVCMECNYVMCVCIECSHVMHVCFECSEYMYVLSVVM